jgi:hypothetical protein
VRQYIIPSHLEPGDLDAFEDHLYVGIAGRQVLVLDRELTQATLHSLPAEGVGEDAPPWCAIHPWTGLLYVSTFNEGNEIHVYDPKNAFAYSGKLALQAPQFGGVQGGCISRSGHLYMISDEFRAAHPAAPTGELMVFSTLDGRREPGLKLPNDPSLLESEECEGLALQPIQIFKPDGQAVTAQLHLVVVDHDWPSRDDVFIYHYDAPDPALV